MPPLAGIVDLTNDPRVEMAAINSLSDSMSDLITTHRIKQEEQLQLKLQSEMIGVLNQAGREQWDGARILSELGKVPNAARSKFYQQMQQQAALQTMKQSFAPKLPQAAPNGMVATGARVDPDTGQYVYTYGQDPMAGLTDDERVKANKIKLGLESKPTAPKYFKGSDGYYAINGDGTTTKTNIPVDDTSTMVEDVMLDGVQTKVLFNKKTGQPIGTLGQAPQNKNYRTGPDGKIYLVEGTKSTPVEGIPAKPNYEIKNQLDVAYRARSRFVDIDGSPKEGYEKEVAKYDEMIDRLEKQYLGNSGDTQIANPVDGTQTNTQTVQPKANAQPRPPAQKAVNIFDKPQIPQRQSQASQAVEIQSTLGQLGLPPEQSKFVLDKLEKDFSEQDRSEFIEILKSSNMGAIQDAINVLETQKPQANAAVTGSSMKPMELLPALIAGTPEQKGRTVGPFYLGEKEQSNYTPEKGGQVGPIKLGVHSAVANKNYDPKTGGQIGPIKLGVHNAVANSVPVEQSKSAGESKPAESGKGETKAADGRTIRKPKGHVPKEKYEQYAKAFGLAIEEDRYGKKHIQGIDANKVFFDTVTDADFENAFTEKQKDMLRRQSDPLNVGRASDIENEVNGETDSLNFGYSRDEREQIRQAALIRKAARDRISQLRGKR